MRRLRAIGWPLGALVLLAILTGCQDSGESIIAPDGAGLDASISDSTPGVDSVDAPIGNDSGDSAAPADTQVIPEGLASIRDLAYLGAFRVSSEDFGASSTNYAVGALGYNPKNHSIFLAGHSRENAIAEFAIPELGLQTDVSDLPLVTAPLQDFTRLLGASPNGNPEDIDRVTGMLWVDGELLINAERWYDAAGDNVDTTLVVRDADDLAGTVDGYFELGGAAEAGGYMSLIPAAWQTALGGETLTGWSSVYSINSRYSIGPTLFVFDRADILNATAGAEGPVSTTALMNFPYSSGEYIDPEAMSSDEGSASPMWTQLSSGVYGFIIPGTRTFAVFGSSGGVDSGIGYKITQDTGNLCGGYCSYAADDNYNYYWFFDLDEIVGATTASEPRPYAYGRWDVPFDESGSHLIIGGTFNTKDNVLYLALDTAGRVGDYDRPPLIVAFGVGQ